MGEHRRRKHNTVAKIKRSRDKMKTDTDKYGQMKKKGNKMNVKIKKNKKRNDIAMLKEMRRQKRKQQRRYRAKRKVKSYENNE